MFDGVDGLDDGLDGVFAIPADCLAVSLLDDLTDDEPVGGFLLAALAGVLAEDLAGVLAGVLVGVFAVVLAAGLTGDLESCCSEASPVKLSSLMGETDDLLFASDFLADVAGRLLVDARFLLVEAEVVRFLLGDGVLLALGRGVPLMGREVRLAGV